MLMEDCSMKQSITPTNQQHKLISKQQYRIVTNRAECLRCGDVIVSMARFGVSTCSCGGIQVGGGNRKLIRGGHRELVRERSVLAFKKADLHPANKAPQDTH